MNEIIKEEKEKLEFMIIEELIMQESFNQNFLVESEKFIELCKNRDLNIEEDDLEFLENVGIVAPIMKVKQNIFFDSTTELKGLYVQGQVIKSQEFVNWENFYEQKDGYREKIVYPYYHIYQMHHIEMILNFAQRRFTKLKEIKEKDLEKYRESSKDDCKIMELLFTVQNKYLPMIRQYSYVYMTPDDNPDKLRTLQKDIIPEKIIEKLNIKIEDINKYRQKIGCRGLSIDPLEKWYPIIRCIKEDKKKELKGKALLAQDYYLMYDILTLLSKDLGKKYATVDSFCNSMDTHYKLARVGKYENVDYCNRDVLERTLYEYGIVQRPRLILIVEGYTEEEFIPIVSNAINIPFDKFGIKIINIGGVDKGGIEALIVNCATPYIDKIYDRNYILDRTKVFILLDKEGKSDWTKKFIKNPEDKIEKMMKYILDLIEKKDVVLNDDEKNILKKNTISCHFWENSLEYDNFNDKELMIELKIYGRHYNKRFDDITIDKVNKCRNDNKNLKKFVEENTCTSLNKIEFGKQLARSIARDIKYGKNKSCKQRPIENVLHKIMEFIVAPKILLKR